MRVPIWVFFLLFTLSGFAGLIYESIWSHYLKLFLGHAAYAQTLVLGLFMGGMAIGAGLTSKFGHRLKSPLIGYSVAELLVGVLALSFHSVFVTITAWGLDSVIPALGAPWQISIVKWVIASALILPASILLGATFPLMSAGIMRAYGDHGGRCLPILYFTNSLGAALGVLASGFVLIGKVGLPGTLFSAGTLNILLALVVWLVARALPASDQAADSQVVQRSYGSTIRPGWLYFAAFATGATSFMFEIAWIRMLSLAIGASTQSFEVMLSAFILGIALGGLALSAFGSRIKDAAKVLGWVIAAKGVLALLAVAFYPSLLDLCQWFLEGLGRTHSGYTLFLFGGYGASMLMMLPTAFCAGMTLPLATQALLAYGRGEKSIGMVYAANTLGAIVGTVLATHVGMELLGVKGVTGVGAGIELALAIALMWPYLKSKGKGGLWPVPAGAALVFVYFTSVQLDPLKMASGIFRFSEFADSSKARVTWYQDGRTATISVVEAQGVLQIRTNGKTDAAINMRSEGGPNVDEHTMVMLGMLGHLHRPGARNVANIGFGSGLTTHTLLGNPAVQRVDTIEIERAMVEGAKAFRPRNERAYTDPRGQLHIEDAKTFLASRSMRYDIIVSEPSNPWVSGVATLFSEEFYQRIKSHLSDQGVLVQWLQLYETQPYIVASILKALSAHFPDYVVYHPGGGDMIIVASPKEKLGRPTGNPFDVPNWVEQLNWLGYNRPEELGALRVGGRSSIQPLVDAFSVRANSDYFPVVDLNAPRERFTRGSATELLSISRHTVPFVAMMEGELAPPLETIANRSIESISEGEQLGQAGRLATARSILLALRSGDLPDSRLPAAIRDALMLVRSGRQYCAAGSGTYWTSALAAVMQPLHGAVRAEDTLAALDALVSTACGKALQGTDRLRFDLIRAMLARDASKIEAASDMLLASRQKFEIPELQNLFAASVTAKISLGKHDEALRFINTVRQTGAWPQSVYSTMLEAHAVRKSVPAVGVLTSR